MLLKSNSIRLILSTKTDFCKNCLKSSTIPKTKLYSHTVLFPRTDFPIKSKNERTEEIQKQARFSELYSWQREHATGDEFVLHDGPPYANGELHMGHAVNKITKDIANRSRLLNGNKIHYIPGWDCHGLPIELKALQNVASKKESLTPIDIRETARKFSVETVEKQKESFRNWGVMADWEKQCYLTSNTDYVKEQLKLFYKMYEMGYIYHALKPVYWSPSSRTALAEAELEYDTHHRSKQVYVAYPMETIPDIVRNVSRSSKVSAIIWTTTPWTLVSNQAICYSPKIKYSLVTLDGRPDQLFIVASSLVSEAEKELNVGMKMVMQFEGAALKGCMYYNKMADKTLPLLEADHVTDSKGTGLVHTAPAHGPDDFVLALRNNITVECNVNEAGCYENLGSQLDGLYVLKEGQDKVIDLLADIILQQGIYVHSYPLDWRTKEPVIVRASQQWFIDTATLKDKALEALEKITILPLANANQYRQGFRAQLEKRPYWCISRQRAWGVPIPVLFKGKTPVVDLNIIERLCSLTDSEGPNAWWTCDVKDLVVNNKQYKNVDELKKGKDIMDIWFDSGISWHLLEGRTADVYSEGVDQLTGWFQSALFTSIALTRRAPYKSIFVHGFVVDEMKRKMSKSLGNVIVPNTIIFGGDDKLKQPAYGVDTLRWWVASHATQHSQIVISKQLLDDCHSEVSRIRNILRYLLGVIGDLENQDFLRKPITNHFDKYMLHETEQFKRQILDHYANFAHNNVAHVLLNFISNKVSGLYCHCVKDRLYCCSKDSDERLSAQLVLHAVLVALCEALGPVLPHLVEEVWQHHPLYTAPFFFTRDIPVLEAEEIDTTVMEQIVDLKKDICALAKNENLKKMAATIEMDAASYDKIIDFDDEDLCEILELSTVKLTVGAFDAKTKWRINLAPSGNNQCLRCRRYNVTGDSDKCERCESVLNGL